MSWETGDLCLGGQLHDSILVCTDEQFLAIGDAQLVKDIGEVMAHRNTGDAQTVGDVFI